MAIRYTIRWATRDEKAVKAIRERFGLPPYTTLNGWTPAEIEDEDRELFEECARRGFFSILPQKWCKNGGRFIFYSR